MRLVAALLLLAACAAPDRDPAWRPAGASEPRRGGTLRFATKDGIPTLDPAVAYDEVSLYALHPMFDTLLDYSHGGIELIPRLAERWEMSDDGLRYRFWLRDGLRYGDGRPIVAADIAYSLERALTLQDSPYGPFLADVVGAAELKAGKAARCAGITVHGERELAIELGQRNASFRFVLAMKFTAPQRADHVAAAGDQVRRRPLASGPYRLVAWDEGRRLVVERNPHYHDPGRNRLERIEVYENVPRDTQFMLFTRGEVDVAAKLAAPDEVWIRSRPAWQPYVQGRAMMNAYGSRMNVRAPPFDDVRVRRALNHAVDKQRIARLLNGTAIPAHGLLPPGVLGRDDELPPYPRDPVRARALLAEAGHAGGLALDYVTIADEEAEKLALALQSDLGEVGVAMSISLVSFPAWATAIGDPGRVPFTFGSWSGDFPDPTSFLDQKLHSRAIDGGTNDTLYANPALDRLLDEARAEPDAAARAAIYRRAERIVHDDAPWIFGYHQEIITVTQPYVRGYAPHPIWLHDFTSVWLDVGPDGRPLPR